MRILLLMLCFIATQPRLGAQDHVIVLVDVSTNPSSLSGEDRISESMRQEALDLVYHMILGSYKNKFGLNWESVDTSNGTLQDLMAHGGEPWIDTGKYLVIIPYGNRNRYSDFEQHYIHRVPQDISVLKNFTSGYNDTKTYRTVAEGFAAILAKESLGVESYRLIKITGLPEDTDSFIPSEEESNYLNAAEQNMNTTSGGSIKYRHSNTNFNISSSKVELINKSQPAKDTITKDDPKLPPHLTITSPKGSKSNPLKSEQDHLSISWNCEHCPEKIDFRLTVKNLDGNGNDKPIEFAGKSHQSKSLSLSPGRNRITLSMNGSSDTVYVLYNETGGSGGFLIILLLLALAALGYWLWKRQRDAEPPAPKPVKSKTTYPTSNPGNDAWDDQSAGSGQDDGHF